MNYYEVSPTKIVRTGTTVLTYASTQALSPGTVVTIPVGATTLLGIVVKQVAQPAYATKLIATIVEETPLPQPIIKLAVWLSNYYATPLATVWQTVLPSGLTTKRRTIKQRFTPLVRDRTHFLLNRDQARAVEAIDASQGTRLLHGVTGSGKTAVYIELTRRALKRQQSVIILVPEIALVSQTVDEFRQHFPDEVLVTHSKQSPAARHRIWQTCLRSTIPRVMLGPRSALFMPLDDVGLIVIDEAHEPSYKQDKAPRYHALRAASYLAKAHEAPLVLGSATPSIVDYYLAQQQNALVTLPSPARTPTPPRIVTVDATKRSAFTRHRFLSNELLDAMEATLAGGHQCLLFHNRRGSAHVSLCTTCGWQAGCPTCLLPLTLHADTHSLRCHACGYTTRVPTHCPQCSSTEVVHKGIGTKLIEAELTKLFPKARIARFDTDTLADGTLDKLYAEVYSGAIDIIIGTQGIAKGLDLPKLRLVGVPQADTGLHLPDYASAERTFQLLSQVVGRVGRYEHPTTVIVQSYHAEHPIIQAGITQDYAGFYAYGLALRQRGHFPPYSFLLKITAIYKTESLAIQNTQKLAVTLRQSNPELTVSQPAPAFYERTPQGYRWQLLIKSAHRHHLVAALAHMPPGPHWQYDLDPSSLL